MPIPIDIFLRETKKRELQPTEDHATFSANHHSKAFNVVHVIAGVVGVVGAAMIAVVAFVVCRRHRRRRRESSYSNNNDPHRISSSSKSSFPPNMKSSQPGLSSSCAPINASSSSKPSSLPFDQFASAFSYDEQRRQQQSSSVALTSPSVSRVAIPDHHLRRHQDDDIEAGPSMQQLQLQYRLMQSSSPPTSTADRHDTSQSPPPPYQP